MTERINAVQSMQDYIHANITDNITLNDLAKVSLFSPWHSYRLFTNILSITPSDYIRKYRLSISALRLRDTSCKIIDIAFEIGYTSVDGYQRAFRREFGRNPRESH